jgi:hypothetical protein
VSSASCMQPASLGCLAYFDCVLQQQSTHGKLWLVFVSTICCTCTALLQQSTSSQQRLLSCCKDSCC